MQPPGRFMPFQFVLQTRAGTDSLAVMLRAAVELDPQATVVSLDGRSAYDTISRATILAKLRNTVPALVPFARAMYARTSTYLWWDDEGRVHEIAQAEGVEQGDPLAPGFYALGQHDSLVAASASLQPTERLAAFLDDLYIITGPDRAAPLLRVVTGEVERGAGVEANLGKTRVYNPAGGDASPGIDLGRDVWCGNLPPAQRGFVALGVPIGHPDIVAAQAADRLAAQDDLLRKLERLPDLQSAWLVLAFCAAPLQTYCRTLALTTMRSGPWFKVCWETRDPASLLRRAGGADPTNLAPEALTSQRLRVNSASEAQVGSDMPFSHFTLPVENARCFRPWLLPLEPSSTFNPVRMPVCG